MPDSMTGDKFRFRFRKSGTLRLVSHHDLMRCGERMLRRAAGGKSEGPSLSVLCFVFRV